jgi:hypothetical protein
MRARKTSSNDRTGERCKYLSGIPENQRGVVIFHGKQ